MGTVNQTQLLVASEASVSCFLHLSCAYIYSIIGVFVGLFLCCILIYRVDQRRQRISEPSTCNIQSYQAGVEEEHHNSQRLCCDQNYARTEAGIRIGVQESGIEKDLEYKKDVEIRPSDSTLGVSFNQVYVAPVLDARNASPDAFSVQIDNNKYEPHLSEPSTRKKSRENTASATSLPPSAMQEILRRLDILVQRNEEAATLSSLVQKLELLFESDLSAPIGLEPAQQGDAEDFSSPGGSPPAIRTAPRPSPPLHAAARKQVLR